jgi:16S rRNA G1207 methylase RsmC
MPGSHYFDADPQVGSQPRQITLALPDQHLRFTTDRGVFSADRVDTGTQLLLTDGPELTDVSSALDLGCGYGPIACTLSLRHPTGTVWAVDINVRARELCAVNAAANHCRDVRACAPDEVPDDVTFDTIWSNPPIRIGKAQMHALLLRWLPRLRPGGTALLVVQRHLGADSLADWLTAEGFATTRLTSRQGYRLLSVAR